MALCFLTPLVAGCTSTPFTSGTIEEAWTFDRIEALPEAGSLNDVTLADALAQRRSARSFAPSPSPPSRQRR